MQKKAVATSLLFFLKLFFLYLRISFLLSSRCIASDSLFLLLPEASAPLLPCPTFKSPFVEQRPEFGEQAPWHRTKKGSACMLLFPGVFPHLMSWNAIPTHRAGVMLSWAVHQAHRAPLASLTGYKLQMAQTDKMLRHDAQE